MALDDDEAPIGTLMTRLVDETRALAHAEIALAKAKIGERIAAYKAAIAFFAVAGVLTLAALIALLVGAILSLATLIGPGWATLAVIGATLLVAGILGFVGKARLAPPTIEVKS